MATASWTGKWFQPRLDQIRRIRGEDPQAVAWEAEREAQVHAQMAKAMVVTPPCAVCQAPSARIELVAPGELPAGWEHWDGRRRDSFLQHREPDRWLLIRHGRCYREGDRGDPIDASRAGQIAIAFRPPLSFVQVHNAGFDATMQDSARTATPRTATGTGTYARAATVTAPAAMARAWIRTGDARPVAALVAQVPAQAAASRPAGDRTPARGGEYRVNPVHDPAYFEDLAGRLYGLVIIFSDRLPADQTEWLHHVVEAR